MDPPADDQTMPIRTHQEHAPDRSQTYPPLQANGAANGGRHRRQQSYDTPQRPDGANRRPSKDDAGNAVSPTRERAHRSRPSGQSRTCGRCEKQLLGQFVRALGGTYHLECFTCQDCGKIVASKFFPVPESGPDQYPLCETDYFRRLDLLCFSCGGALRGSYITALDRKYHIEHFTCSVCPTVFGAQDSYYEHEGNVYCHYHYSTRFAQRCNGCQTAILKQFVEIFRNGQNQHWHPECYMIHKYWNVRLHQGQAPVQSEDRALDEAEATDEMRKLVRNGEEKVEEKVLWIWRTLSAFEEKSATCISDMLLHVSNGAYVDGVMSAKKFITHVDVLFNAADDLDEMLVQRTQKGLSYGREAKLLCKKVVAFFQLLAESQETGVRRLGVTQELLSLVTGLAHYLKLLIRICLQGALKLERETGTPEGLNQFLLDISKLEERLELEHGRESRSFDHLGDRSADLCAVCDKACEDKCYRKDKWIVHAGCFKCAKCDKSMVTAPSAARWNESTRSVFCERHGSSVDESGFTEVTRLQQYVHLLRVSHARLLDNLRTSGALPHTSDDPNLSDYDSQQGHRVAPDGKLSPKLLQNTRSKSYTGSSPQDQQSQSYEEAIGDIKRLRSTRMDKQLSTTTRKARTSRIIDAPDAMQPGSPGKMERRRTGQFQIVDDVDANGGPISSLNFSGGDAMTLDDIPRLVQAQQTREQRPNASRFARQPMIPQEPKVKLVNGHTRNASGTLDEKLLQQQHPVEAGRSKKYFSELSALEYFIVRHVAVLSLEPLLEGHFNQEQLLDLIETKRPTFWEKFGSAFAKKDNKPKGKKKGVFGVALEQLVERDYAESTDGVGPGALRIPAVVQDSISAMRTMDMSIEGVFRKNGNIKRLNDLKEEVDTNGTEKVDLTRENPVQVANMLKKFFRDLPDPLLTFKLHRLWITSTKIADEEKRRRVLHLTCCLLPKAHRDTMEVLFNFLNWVSSFSHVDEESGSKMDIHNLATVMTPNILYLTEPNKTGGPVIDVNVNDSFLAIEAVHELIYHNEAMCEIPEDLSLILNDSSLFSSSADITTKEILKRYGDRARVPTVHASSTPQPSSTFDGPAPGSPRGRDANGRPTITPVATRVDRDEVQGNAWNNESSVRHVQEGNEGWNGFGQHGNDSRESLGRRGLGIGGGRAMGVT
ncbi:Rho-type GTPase-activating protein 1 [Sphaceloma murrayae]|uniref:Rho-type GTPase-activating protein 1 n=1 Tax=Sphaceloma murrayae TaxID=2082308 RepID=A0A2K1QL26_9PEZI|nr:Rho-type GTPase-activating protein 1 [Sphaceloma murrayae]